MPPKTQSDQPPRAEFTLDRDRLQRRLTDEYGEEYGSVWWHEDGIAAALSRVVRDAEDAIDGPADIRIQTYPVDFDALLVCVRERSATKFPLRQVASYSIETKHLVNPDAETLDECFDAIAEVVRQANLLLPAFHALRAGEQQTPTTTPGQ